LRNQKFSKGGREKVKPQRAKQTGKEPSVANLKVAYVLLRFPCMTETFVAEEIQKIQDEGIEVCIYSLLNPRDVLVHPVSQALLPLARKAPGFGSPSLWAAQFHFLRRSPGQYFKLLRTLMGQPAPGVSYYFKRFAVFLKGVWIARDLQSRGVQTIHAHFAWLSGASAWVISELLGLPFTVTTHAYDIYSERNDLLDLTTREAARVVTISQKNRAAMLEKCEHLASDKIKVIHCGVDLAFFEPNAKDGNGKQGPLRITSVGSLIPKKGHETLIRACGKLKERGVDFNCTIVGVGGLEAPLKALIGELGLEEQVKLAGAQSQVWVRNQLANSDVFALACVQAGGEGQDGIPVAMMEALAMGVPVISTPVSGIPELIEQEVSGLLVPQRDAEKLADAIMRIAEDGDFRQALQKGGRGVVEREYDITLNVRVLSDTFSEVVKEHERNH